jgi:ankyrin repeat protein
MRWLSRIIKCLVWNLKRHNVEHLPPHVADDNDSMCASLFDAAQVGNLLTVKFILKHKPETLYRRNTSERSALMIAAQHGQLSVVRYLIKFGANVLARDFRNQTAFHLSCKNGHFRVMMFLWLNCEVDMRRVNSEGRTALLLAVQGGNLEIVKLLLLYDLNANVRDIYGQDMIIIAAYEGHTKMVEWMMKNGSDLDTRDYSALTPLMVAARAGRVEIVICILEAHHKSLNQKDRFGRTAFLLAAKQGHVSVLSALFNSNAALTDVDQQGRSALMLAVREGHVDCVDWLLANQVDTKHKDFRGWNAALTAASYGHLGILQRLFETDPETIDIVDYFGRTPFLEAAKQSYIDIAKWISGISTVNASATDKAGRTALMLCVLYQHIDYHTMVEWLLHYHKLDPLTLDNHGQSTWSMMEWPVGRSFGWNFRTQLPLVGRCLLIYADFPEIHMTMSIDSWKRLNESRDMRSTFISTIEQLPFHIIEATTLSMVTANLVFEYAFPSVEDVWNWFN